MKPEPHQHPGGMIRILMPVSIPRAWRRGSRKAEGSDSAGELARDPWYKIGNVDLGLAGIAQ